MFLLRFCQIYIPLWLDLLLFNLSSTYELRFNLHSTMVRFIIYHTFITYFDYVSIYIPLWLDLLSVFSAWNMKRLNLLHIKFRVSQYKKYITLQNTNLFQKTCLSISRKILYITYRHTRILYKIWSFVNIFFYQKLFFKPLFVSAFENYARIFIFS